MRKHFQCQWLKKADCNCCGEKQLLLMFLSSLKMMGVLAYSGWFVHCSAVTQTMSDGWRIRPVFATRKQGYHYASKFGLRMRKHQVE